MNLSLSTRPYGVWLFFVTTLALLAVAAPAHAVFPGANGKIAFVSNRTGNYDIYTMNADGGDVTALTNDAAVDLGPAWSPDGQKIAFVSDRGGGPRDIWVMNADGSGLTRLTTLGYAGSPAWSPDGKKIALEQGGNIWTVDADGANLTTLDSRFCDDATLTCTSFGAPSWSPDGRTIIYGGIESDYENPNGSIQSDIWSIPATGGSHTNVTNTRIYEESPDWAPNESRIAFDSYPGPSGPGSEIWTMNPDGSNRTQLTNDPTDADEPTWSPDQSRIAFTSVRDGNREIYAINADGSGQTNLTNNGASDYEPAWQPIPQTYVRPRGASPFLTYLVPAYQACSVPNRTHGAPLAFGSCAPPTQTSSELTLGTPDSNGRPAATVGSVRYRVAPGDVKIDVNISGVLTQPALTPYGGELRLQGALRITDRDNTPNPGGPGPGTLEDASFPVTVPCAAGTCSVATTANAVAPGAVVGGQRAIWQLGQVKVYDGGADGLASTTADNTLFMDEGIFVP